MRRISFIIAGIFLALSIGSAVILTRPPRIQVVGSLSPSDLAQIQKLARGELRYWILPKPDWDNVHHLNYVVRKVREYEAVRILWMDVKPDGSVEVFAGVSKEAIRSEGHAMTLRKQPNWQITGYGYWGFSNVAPHDMHIPPPQ